MKFYYLLHTMLAQKGANAVKILSVSVGLLVSCIIFSSLAYIYSYDTFYKDYKNLYAVQTTYDFGGKVDGPTIGSNWILSGAIAEELPDDVIASGMLRMFERQLKCGEKMIETDVALSDSMIFETTGLKLISGYPRKDLAVADVIYLSRSLAREFFGDEDPIGKTIKIDDVTLTVKGLYEDIPENVTRVGYKGIISYPTYRALDVRDPMDIHAFGRTDVFIRRLPGSKIAPEVITSKLNEIQQRLSPDEDSQMKLTFSVIRVDKIFLSHDRTKRTATVMWVLGLSLLLLTTLNYSLITIASLSRRAKAIGVHKCSGASGLNVISMFLSETLLILAISFIVMLALVFAFQPLLDSIPQFSVERMLSPHWLWVIGAVLLFFFLVGGILPGILFSKIPVTQVFRRFTDRNGAWKKSLLFIQLTGVSFIGGILVMLSTQYREVMTHDMGFDLKNKAIFGMYMSEMKPEVMESALKSLPYVKSVCTVSGMPLSGKSQRIFYSSDGKIALTCSYVAYSPGFMEMMKFHLLEGRYPDNISEVVVNETFCKRMNFGDSIVGRKVDNDHLTIVGVVKDYAQWGFMEEIEPAMIQPSSASNAQWLVELAEPSDKNYEKFVTFLEEKFPAEKLYPRSSNDIMDRFYMELKSNRDSSLIAAVALVMIALMGLIGFTRDEVERRRKEIAIRKVNGATAGTVISMMCGDLLKISIPAVIIGLAFAWYLGQMLIEVFTVKVQHLPVYMLLAGMVILAAVMLCVVLVSRRVANENPVTQLKSE